MCSLIDTVQINIACLILASLTSICSQVLYETDNQQSNILNRESKKVSVQSLLEETDALLKKKTSDLQDCVDKGDDYNDLMMMYSRGQIPNDTTIDIICTRHPNLIIKNTDDCHRYYNCSGEDYDLSRWIPMYRFWPSKFKHECHYPLMFSEETMQCENFTSVNCGTRYKPTWECRYFRFQCKLSHCIDCEIFYPKCENLPDGNYPYLTSSRHCNSYYKCESGRSTNIKCPDGTVFDAARRMCAVGGIC